MLKKCLKYDLRSILPIWWILALSILLISPIGGFAVRTLISSDDSSVGAFPLVMSGLGVGVTSISYTAFLLVTEILICYRYYQNFFTDSGYLTFTLPVRRSTLFFSKIISGCIWYAATALVLLAGVSLLLLVVPGLEGTGSDFPVGATTALGSVWKLIAAVLNGVWEACGAWLLLYLLEGIVILIGIFLSSLLFLYLCITIGCMIAKKNKVLVSIAIYYGFNWGLSLFASILFTFGGSAVVSMGFAYPDAFANPSLVFSMVALLLLLAAVVVSIICTVYWLISLGSVERRLNLQ